MKCVLTCSSYEEANERQLDLIAAGIDAVVVYIPTGADQAYFGRLPVYIVIVDEERLEEAKDLFR